MMLYVKYRRTEKGWQEADSILKKHYAKIKTTMPRIYQT